VQTGWGRVGAQVQILSSRSSLRHSNTKGRSRRYRVFTHSFSPFISTFLRKAIDRVARNKIKLDKETIFNRHPPVGPGSSKNMRFNLFERRLFAHVNHSVSANLSPAMATTFLNCCDVQRCRRAIAICRRLDLDGAKQQFFTLLTRATSKA